MKKLRISPKLQLPLELAGEATAILAKRGAGKTNTAKVLVEEILTAGGVQVVVLDPVGVWWALRAGADGKPRGGYPVAVFGGEHGDLPLEPTAGRVLAETAVESGQSIVLDVSGLDSDGAMQRFAYEFAERLYTLKQRRPTPLLLVLEEADEFAPQDTRGPNVPRMVGAYARLVKRGRSRGIGVLVISQRSAALNKNVLDQADTLVVMRIFGPRDRDAIERWTKHQQAEGVDEVLPSLPGLETGEAWFWNPERGLLERVKVRKARTYDSSQTPAGGGKTLDVEVKPIDVDQLGEAIRATVERTKQNDPKELRRMNAELQRKLEDAERAIAVLERTKATVEERVETVVEKINTPRSISPCSKTVRPPSPPASPLVDGLTGPEQRVLDALAWYEALGIHTPTKLQVGFVAGYRVGKKVGGTYGNILGTLRSQGLIDYPSTGSVALSPAGRDLSRDPGIGHGNEAMQNAVIARLDGPERRVLENLIRIYPDEISKQELGERSGYTVGEKIGGTYGNILGRLRSLGLIDYPGPGLAVATDVLFPEGG